VIKGKSTRRFQYPTKPSDVVKTVKLALHPRNLHRGRYNFPQLIATSPELAAFVSANAYGDASIDFANPAAVSRVGWANGFIVCPRRLWHNWWASKKTLAHPTKNPGNVDE